MSSPAVCVHIPVPVPVPILFVSFQFSAVLAPFPFVTNFFEGFPKLLEFPQKAFLP